MDGDAFSVLQKRGFVKQCSDQEEMASRLAKEKIIYYIGFDPTADSLHVGSLVPIMAMAHLQRLGHFPICVIGGGTAMIGDPSGKTEMRKMITRQNIANNSLRILLQLKKYLSLDGQNGMLVDNADWLLGLKYVEFLRDIGKHFKVNEMIRAEAYKQRLERQEGLSFIEFNYQILQAYDFLTLFDKHNCSLQLGGDDQWGNILAGVDLVRRVRNKRVYGLTFPLLVTAGGNKMGKTESGTIWLDSEKTSPYEFYQYWINADDRDVVKFLNYFTFLPQEEILSFKKDSSAEICKAKEVLAFEATKLTHGEEEAVKAKNSAKAVFANMGGSVDSVPTSEIDAQRIKKGILLVELLCEISFCKTKSEARRLIEQGGVSLNGGKIVSADLIVNESFVKNSVILIRRGKKQYRRIVFKGEVK